MGKYFGKHACWKEYISKALSIYQPQAYIACMWKGDQIDIYRVYMIN